MNNEASAGISQLTVELDQAANRAIEATRVLRETIAELNFAREELRAIVQEARRHRQPWESLNFN